MAFLVGYDVDVDVARYLFLVVLAMQQPDCAVFLKCCLVDDDPEGSHGVYIYADWNFVIGSADLEGYEDCRLKHVALRGELVAPFGEADDATMFCARLLARDKEVSAAETTWTCIQRKTSIRSLIKEKLPWLTEKEIDRHLCEDEEADAEEEEDGSDDEAKLDEEAERRAEAAMDAYATARARIEPLEANPGADFTHFYPKLFGGGWTYQNVYAPYDRIAAMAREHTADFRKTFGVQQYYSFALGKFEGEENAHKLVMGWVNKLTFFYRVWQLKDRRLEQFTPDEVAAFEHSDEWLEWAQTHPPDGVVFKAVKILWDFVPQLAA